MNFESQSESLLSSANDTAKLVRGVHLSFLLVMAYIAIVVSSTTDIQLLKLSPVTLPLLNTKLPIVEFYVLTPWLLLLLHFNLLLQSYMLARKLHRLNLILHKCNDETADSIRNRLFSFALSQNIVGMQDSSLMRFLLNSLVVITIVIMPLVLLTWTQIRFIPYHDDAITSSHRIAVLLDCLMLWIIWPMIILPEGQFKRWLLQNILLIQQLLTRSTARAQGGDKILLRGRGQTSLFICSVSMLFISWFVAVQPMANDKGEKLSQSWITERLFDLPGKPFHQDIYIKNAILVKGSTSAKIEAALKGDNKDDQARSLKNVVGLPLQGRNLQFSTFIKCVMPKVNLARANLQGAEIRQSFLYEGNFNDADLSNVKLYNSNFKKSRFEYAYLNDALIIGSDFSQANLFGVEMYDAILIDSMFNGANLKSVNVADATFVRAKIKNIFLDKEKKGTLNDY